MGPGGLPALKSIAKTTLISRKRPEPTENRDQRERFARLAVSAMQFKHGSIIMHGIIYLVGLVVVVLFILSFFGLR
ncbi:MAG: hypothetical protein Q8Q62_15320 [Mesorhizobium sp.]|nr:hypothetical protein [Mesorhizobium sp.]